MSRTWIPEWTTRALCAEVDSDVFFGQEHATASLARRICSLCEVSSDCLSYALSNGIDEGIWGGATAKQRRKLRAA